MQLYETACDVACETACDRHRQAAVVFVAMLSAMVAGRRELNHGYVTRSRSRALRTHKATFLLARPSLRRNVAPSARSPLDYNISELKSLDCLPRDSYTNFTFDGATLVLSNLGGQRGRCENTCYGDGQCVTWSDLCVEQQPTTNVPDANGLFGNMHILFRGMGVMDAGQDLGREIWLRVTNETECPFATALTRQCMHTRRHAVWSSDETP
jgi:hypothetical protein